MQVPRKVLAVVSNVSLVVKLVNKGDNYRFPFYFSLFGLFSNNETVTGTMQNYHHVFPDFYQR